MTTVCATCGHLEDHHDAGECWAEVDGQEQCGCSWYEPRAGWSQVLVEGDNRGPATRYWVRATAEGHAPVNRPHLNSDPHLVAQLLGIVLGIIWGTR